MCMCCAAVQGLLPDKEEWARADCATLSSCTTPHASRASALWALHHMVIWRYFLPSHVSWALFWRHAVLCKQGVDLCMVLQDFNAQVKSAVL